jgi:polyferredoxin
MSARYVQPLRVLIQFCFLGFMLRLGVRFYRFVHYLRSDGQLPYVPRPDGIEGFLPISGLLGTVSWLKGNSINPIHPAAVVILLTVLAVALLLRRSFCSWICPVAVLSECAWNGGFKLLRRNPRLPRRLDLSLRGVKYLLLGFFVWSVAVVMSPVALEEFINSDYHKLADVRLLDFFRQISPVALGVLLTLLLLSLMLKNPFCRYLCPYGALLGLVAMLSPIRVTRNSERCVSCGVCSQVCPTYIDVMRKKSVNSPECIGCWRCVSHCRFNQALSMRVAGRFVVPGIVFALLVVLVFWGGSVIGKRSGNWQTALDISEYRRLLRR